MKILTAEQMRETDRRTAEEFGVELDELMERAEDVFGMIGAGKLKLRIEHIYPLAEVQRAHEELEGRKTTGKLLLIP